jgi:hypothetical protein
MRNLFFFGGLKNKTNYLRPHVLEKINFTPRDRFLKAILKTITLNVKKGNDDIDWFWNFTKVKRSAR